jgi:hypothetical protein
VKIAPMTFLSKSQGFLQFLHPAFKTSHPSHPRPFSCQIRSLYSGEHKNLPHIFLLLDPYLGYLHSIQFAKPSLVCGIQEVFRGLIDEFLIGYSQKLKGDDFEDKGGEDVSEKGGELQNDKGD